MDARKILHQLTYAEGLPTEALKAASDQRVEMLLVFLDESKPTSRWHLPLGRNRRRCSSSFICSGNGGKGPLIDR
jgi:hypothetical protein